MSDLRDYTTAIDVARETGLKYHTVMARVKRMRLEVVRIGHSVLIHRDHVAKISTPIEKSR